MYYIMSKYKKEYISIYIYMINNKLYYSKKIIVYFNSPIKTKFKITHKLE